MTDEEKPIKYRILDFVTDNFKSFLTVVVLLVGSWYGFMSRIDDLQRKVEALEAASADHVSAISTLDTKVTEMNVVLTRIDEFLQGNPVAQFQGARR